ncbi:RES family NAD+ phosphorylase [Rhodococcus sp. IEGM 1408]|uniref:RES family NAD+ phosphorylase n=1 Tax=Rhodococcus sp. IEGM 1408 TaxID=3082220 RepID=UPI00295509E9|nr:RES family NAD+ phosphorylase [Rhodococcus sp. IEGM 1408]MDV8001462.1 RES family NAD+ phosphorylase [Rhodococcus sp. IEGM 1408]
MVDARFPLPAEVPPPEPDDCTTLGDDQLLWRIVFTSAPYALPWNTARTHGPHSRFDPHPLPIGDHSDESSWYAALTPSTAIGECFQRDRMIDARTGHPYLYAARLGRPVRLLDLTAGSTWAIRAGGHHGLSHEQHSVAQHWARAIRAADPEVDGMLYRSSYGPSSSVVLFSTAADSLAAAHLEFERPLQHSGLRDLIISAADELGYEIG